MGLRQKIILLTQREYAPSHLTMLKSLIREGFSVLLVSGPASKSWESQIDQLLNAEPAPDKPFVAGLDQAPLYELVSLAMEFPGDAQNEVRMIRA